MPDSRVLHQFIPTLDPGAVGAHTLEIQRTLRNAGWESEIFSEFTREHYTGLAHRFTDYGKTIPADDADIVVYHAAIGSSVADWLMSRRPRRLVVDYHNITPPVWFETWEPGLAYGLGWGRAQLRRLGRRARFGIADSAYNATELEQAGFRRTAVLPILIPPESLGGAPDAGLVERLRSGPGARWVFVGRVAPNKRQHLLIAALSVYRRVYDPDARLFLVGGSSSVGYQEALRRYASDLGIADAVVLTGPVSDGERNAYYAAGDVFVCASGHEGFCVPLLEAWQHRLPIVAVASSAVPETLGHAGLLLPSTSPYNLAAAVSRVVGDPTLADGLRAAGTSRLADFSIDRTRRRVLELAEALAGGLADRPQVGSNRGPGS
ncbi:MAG: glycosyltransferase family 4 protein [Acidimicrobiales bacterium]